MNTNMNMVELNAAEIEEVNGGWVHLALAAIAIYDAASDFCEGFAAGYNAK